MIESFLRRVGAFSVAVGEGEYTTGAFGHESKDDLLVPRHLRFGTTFLNMKRLVVRVKEA
jgi:hypothetical protein